MGGEMMKIIIYYDTDAILEKFYRKIPKNRFCLGIEPSQDYDYIIKMLEMSGVGESILIEYPEMFKTLPEIFELCKEVLRIAKENDLSIGIKTKLEDVIFPFLKFVSSHDMSVDELRVVYRGKEKTVYEDGTIEELEDSSKFTSLLW